MSRSTDNHSAAGPPATSPVEVLKNPYVLEFLGLPDVAEFHESYLEEQNHA